VSESDLSLITFSVYKFIDGVGHVIDYYGMSDNGDDQFNPGAYGFVGRYISEIVGNDPLQSAGKIMGLSAYGKVREEWIDPLKSFYKNAPQDYWGKFYYLTHQLSQKMKLTLDYKVLSGQDSYDLAATNQHVFEELCFSFIKKYIDKYEMNVVFSGGCALNVLFNQKLFKYVRDKGLNLYVPPYPGDNGLSFGHYTSFQNLKCDPGPYCGIDILDRNKIIDYYSKYNKEGKVKLTTVETIVDLIKDGKIGGIIQGYSEVGPRALGNRSIICDPSISDMKNILNSKVKFREWFRPFAPVCREEDREIYFEDAFPSEYMSFAPKVKESYRNLLPSITHEDGTARLQTVTKQQHELFYDILTEIRNRDLIGVIMNTSFNIRGKPILTSIDDAFEVLETTELDFIVVENLLFIK
jgi:carbamoyltransferase